MTRSAAEIAESLGGHRVGAGWLARCPAHEDARPSLSIRASAEGRLLVHCFAGCHSREIIAVLRQRGLWVPATADRGNERRIGIRVGPASSRDAASRSELLRQIAIRIWRASKPATETLAETYFRARGITIPVPASVCFLERAWHRPSGRSLPAIVVAVQAADRRITGVHRTFLAPDGAGKAAAAPNKMMLGQCAGGAARFARPGPVLAIAEGVETALSVLQATGLPTWAALSALASRPWFCRRSLSLAKS